MYAALKVQISHFRCLLHWGVNCKHVSLHMLFGKDLNTPNFCSIADAAIMLGYRESGISLSNSVVSVHFTAFLTRSLIGSRNGMWLSASNQCLVFTVMSVYFTFTRIVTKFLIGTTKGMCFSLPNQIAVHTDLRQSVSALLTIRTRSLIGSWNSKWPHVANQTFLSRRLYVSTKMCK